MSKREWATVLRTIYEEDLVWEKGTNYDKNHPVVSATGMKPEVVQNNLAFLAQAGLIESVHAGINAEVSRVGDETRIPIAENDRRTGAHIGLSARGFQVMHERESNKVQEKSNGAIVILTVGLMAAAMIQAVTGLVEESFAVAGSIVILLLALIMIIVLSRSDWFPEM